MRTARPKPPRLAVPHSNACVQVMIDKQGAEFSGEGPAVQVRCRACEQRLFDVAVGRSLRPAYGMVPDGTLVVERRCPSCKRTNRGAVTGIPGDPLTDGLRGPWRCEECGKFLGYVEHIRGRVRATCRCKAKVRATASEVIRLASVS